MNLLEILNGPRFLFDADGGSGGDENDDSHSENPNGDSSDADDGKIVFTPEQQSHIDKIIAAARREGKTKGGESAVASLLSDLGVEDADSARALIDAANKARKENQTEVDRLTEENQNLSTKLTKTETDSAASIRKSNLRVLRTEIRLEAANQGVRPDAVADVPALLNLDELLKTFDDETEEFTGIEDAVKNLIKDREYLIGSNDNGDGHGTPRQGKKPKGKKTEPTGPLVRF